MRTVFSNDELAHIWASQSQDAGRNSGGSFYFRGAAIYSYRDSWALAIFTPWRDSDGLRIVLRNADTYGNTTNRHDSHVWRALRGLPVRVVSIPGLASNHVPGNRGAYSATLDCIRARVEDETAAAAKRRDPRFIYSHFGTIREMTELARIVADAARAVRPRDWRETLTRAQFCRDAERLIAAAAIPTDLPDGETAEERRAIRAAAAALRDSVAAYRAARDYSRNLQRATSAVESARAAAGATDLSAAGAMRAILAAMRERWPANRAAVLLDRARDAIARINTVATVKKPRAIVAGIRIDRARAEMETLENAAAPVAAAVTAAQRFAQAAEFGRRESRLAWYSGAAREAATGFADAAAAVESTALRARLTVYAWRAGSLVAAIESRAARLDRKQAAAAAIRDIASARDWLRDFTTGEAGAIVYARAESMARGIQDQRTTGTLGTWIDSELAPLLAELEAARPAYQHARDRETVAAWMGADAAARRAFAIRGLADLNIYARVRPARDVVRMAREAPRDGIARVGDEAARAMLAELDTAAETAGDLLARADAIAIDAWRAYQTATIYDCGRDLLRVSRDGTAVETSRGARVSVLAARVLWRMVRRVVATGAAREFGDNGPRIGAYMLRTIRADGSAVIGCHDIGADEMSAAAAALGFPAIGDAVTDTADPAAA